MITDGVTHQYGPWTPIRFRLTPFVGKNDRPGLYVSTSRMCTGMHDWRCTTAETQTYGPFTMDDQYAAGIWTCPTCHLHQLPAETTGASGDPLCLNCSDQSQTTIGYERAASAAASAGIAYRSASDLLTRAMAADPDGAAVLLTDITGALCSVLETADNAVANDPTRARHTLYGALTLIARQILANARDLAAIPTAPTDGE